MDINHLYFDLQAWFKDEESPLPFIFVPLLSRIVGKSVNTIIRYGCAPKLHIISLIIPRFSLASPFCMSICYVYYLLLYLVLHSPVVDQSKHKWFLPWSALQPKKWEKRGIRTGEAAQGIVTLCIRHYKKEKFLVMFWRQMISNFVAVWRIPGNQRRPKEHSESDV